MYTHAPTHMHNSNFTNCCMISQCIIAFDIDEEFCLLFCRAGENGRYYCGMQVLECSCCDGHCGPTNGCNCSACQQLDKEDQKNQQTTGKSLNNTSVSPSSTHPSKRLIDSWTWSQQPGRTNDLV